MKLVDFDDKQSRAITELAHAVVDNGMNPEYAKERLVGVLRGVSVREVMEQAQEIITPLGWDLID